MKFGIYFSVPCIKTAISNHFKVFFRDVSDEAFDEINGRDGFFYIFFVFMAIVMKSNEFTIVLINSGSGNNRATKITTDILDNVLRCLLYTSSITVDGQEIKIYAKANAEELPWGEIGVDVVLECTGFYTSKEKASAHIKAGAKKVVILSLIHIWMSVWQRGPDFCMTLESLSITMWKDHIFRSVWICAENIKNQQLLSMR